MKSPPSNPSAPFNVVQGTALQSLFRYITSRFRNEGLATPELDARLILCHACALTHEQFVARPEYAITQDEAKRLVAMAARRLAREPVSRILGAREFRGLDFAIGSQTLDPRPDTETLVEAALECIEEDGKSDSCSILDLGTGSGCILVSLLHVLPQAHGVGIDINADALETAGMNARTHGVSTRAQFVCSNWAESVTGSYDIVVSNPPYIPTGDIALLEPEVAQFDPKTALDGGEDGLVVYRALIPCVRNLLSPGGWVLFEVGVGQAEPVGRLLHTELGLEDKASVRYWHDLSGHIRCVGAKHSPINE